MVCSLVETLIGMWTRLHNCFCLGWLAMILMYSICHAKHIFHSRLVPLNAFAIGAYFHLTHLPLALSEVGMVKV